MYDTAASRIEKRLVATAAISASLAGAIGIAGVFGWAFDVAAFKYGPSGDATMKANTALGLIVSSAAVVLLAKGGRAFALAGRSSGGFVLALGFSTMVGHLFGVNLGIDEIFFRDAQSAIHPGRMALSTATGFSLLGGALLLVGRGPRATRVADGMALASGAQASIAILGHLYGVESLHRIEFFGSMAAHTAAAHFVLAVAVLFLAPGKGLLEPATRADGSGLLLRRLVPMAVLVPALAGWLNVMGRRHGLFGVEFGDALFVIACGSVSCVIIWRLAKTIGRAESEVGRLNAELETRVRERTAELAAANREMEAFSYSVSHDLRSPLRAISGLCHIVTADHAAEIPEPARRHLETVQSSATRMGRLIDDLLAFSRLGRQRVAMGPLDTREVVECALKDLEHEREKRQIELRVGELLPAAGDPALVLQVFANLLSNAIKFTRRRDRAIIEISSRCDGPEIVFSVRDNGAGFDTKYRSKLFGVFQRLHGADEFPGTGIGLSIVQRIVQKHGGRIWAESRLGEGATFHFSLPRQASVAASKPALSPE